MWRAAKKYEKLSSAEDIEMGKVGKDGQKEAASLNTKNISFVELMLVLAPFFWPAPGTDGAVINRIRTTSTWFMVALSKGANLIAPIYLARGTNYLIDGDFHEATVCIVIYIGLRFAATVFKELQSILYIRVKQEASIQLQEITFRHIHNLSLNWHLSKKTGSVMKSLDRGVSAADTLVTYLFLFLIPAILECISVMILFFIQFKQWALGLTVFLGIALYAVVTVVVTSYRKKFREQTNKHDNDAHDKATDSIINYETVKYFTGEEFEVNRFTHSVREYQKFSSSTQFSSNILNISQQFFVNLTMLFCMLIAGHAVIHHQMTIGGWIAVQTWVATIFAPLNFLGMVYQAVIQAFIDIRNLTELLSQSPDIQDSTQSTDIPLPVIPGKTPTSSRKTITSSSSNPLVPAIQPYGGVSVEFRNVSFHYPEQPVERGLKNVSFYVKPGTTTAIVGHTGSGKTTLSRLLFRFYDPLEGLVLINGHNVKDYKQKSIRQAIGIVPQDTVLFNDTILHNVEYGRIGASFEEIEAAAEAAQIKTFIESLPEKWKTVVGERGLKLSGGEKQRVAIARCLLKNPPIVLLDEATSALDTLTESSIQEALQTLGKNRTVIVIAHRLSTIRHADQIIVMDNGKIAEMGSHDQLISKGNTHYAKMWQIQVTPVSQMMNKHSNFTITTEEDNDEPR
jgi:ABC-type transport system involved in Fe-S cluster assembly fused permease/ATPase subunit